MECGRFFETSTLFVQRQLVQMRTKFWEELGESGLTSLFKAESLHSGKPVFILYFFFLSDQLGDIGSFFTAHLTLFHGTVVGKKKTTKKHGLINPQIVLNANFHGCGISFCVVLALLFGASVAHLFIQLLDAVKGRFW